MQFMAPLFLLALACWSASVGDVLRYGCLSTWILHGFRRLLQAIIAWRNRGQSPCRRYRRIAQTETATTIRSTRAKPEWIKHEVLRLKALMPHTGCRKIADIFNRRFEEARKMTVGKTYVSNAIRQHYHEILVLRRQIKNAKPKSVPKNMVWAIDLTGKTALDGRTQQDDR